MEGRESRARFCATCGERLDPDALFCAACGAHVGAGQPGGWVTLEFRGTVSQAYVWIPWWILLSLLVIPAGWGVASLSRWYLRNLWFSDGTEAWFEGSGGQIWWYFVVQGVFGAIGSFVPFLGLAFCSRLEHQDVSGVLHVESDVVYGFSPFGVLVVWIVVILPAPLTCLWVNREPVRVAFPSVIYTP